jgi:type I restriction enzyme S subunit
MVSAMTNVEPIKIPEGYKQTEVGVIPEDWNLKPLVSLCKVIDGDRGNNYPNGNDFSSDGFCVFLSAANVTKKGFKFKAVSYISKAKDKILRQGKLKRGDIVLTTRGSVGHFSYYNDSVYFENLRINSGMVIVRNESPNIGNDYLYSILSSPFIGNQIETMSFGSALPQLTVRDINGFYLCFPKDKQEQTAIANALSDVDNLIASLETLIAKKSAIKTAAMQQLLTGKKRLPAFVNESEKQGAKQSSELYNTREAAQAAQTKQASTLNSGLYKESGEGLDAKLNQHSEVGNANNKQTAPRPGYKQTELGEIPEDWEVVELGTIADFYKGKGLPKSELSESGAYKCIHYGELFTHYSEKIVEIKSLTDTAENTFLSKSNDILMPTSDVTPNGLATASGLKEDGVILGGDVLVIRPKQEKLDSTYFAYIIGISKGQVMQLISGSTVYHLYGSDMATFKYAGPKNIKEQTAIANVLSDMDTELDALQQRLSKTQKIKQGMMQELLTGKTRLV